MVIWGRSVLKDENRAVSIVIRNLAGINEFFIFQYKFLFTNVFSGGPSNGIISRDYLHRGLLYRYKL